MQRKTLGNRHPHTLMSINNLGGLLKKKGDLAASESLLREALEGRRETLGDRHLSTIASRINLSALLQKMSNLAVTSEGRAT